MALSPERKKIIIIIAVILGILVLAGGISGIIILARTKDPPSPPPPTPQPTPQPTPEGETCPNNSYTYEDSNENCIECPSNQYVGPNKTCVYCDSGYEYSRSEDSCMMCDPSKGQFYDEDTYSCGTYCETGVECNINEVCRGGLEKVINNEYQITMCCKEGETIFKDKDSNYTCGNWCESEESCSADGICVNDDHTNIKITTLNSSDDYACCPNTDSDGNSITPAWTGSECCTDDKLYYDKVLETFRCCSQDGGVVFNNEDFTDSDGNTVNYPTTCCLIKNSESIYNHHDGTNTYTGECCSLGVETLGESEVDDDGNPKKKTFLDKFFGDEEYDISQYTVYSCIPSVNCNTEVDSTMTSEDIRWNNDGAACTTVCGYENEKAYEDPTKAIKNYCCATVESSCGDYCSFDDTKYSCVDYGSNGKTLCPKDNVYVENSIEKCCIDGTLTNYETLDNYSEKQPTKCCSVSKTLGEDEDITCCGDNQYPTITGTKQCCDKNSVIWEDPDDETIAYSCCGNATADNECCSTDDWIVMPDNSKKCATTCNDNDVDMLCPSSHTCYINGNETMIDKDGIVKLWSKLSELYGNDTIYCTNNSSENWDSGTTYGKPSNDDGTTGLKEITNSDDFATYCVKNFGSDNQKQIFAMCLPDTSSPSACVTEMSTTLIPSIPDVSGQIRYPYSTKIVDENWNTYKNTDYSVKSDDDDFLDEANKNRYWGGDDGDTVVYRIEQEKIKCDNNLGGTITCLRNMSYEGDNQENVEYVQFGEDYGLCTKISSPIYPPVFQDGIQTENNSQNLLNISTALSTASDSDNSYTAWTNYQFTTNPCKNINDCIGNNGSWALTGPGSGVCIPHLDNDYSIGYYDSENGGWQASPDADDGILSKTNVLLVENNSITGPCPQSDLNSGRIWGNTKATSQAAIEYMNASGTVKSTDTNITTDDEVVIVENRTPYYVKYSYLKAEDSLKGSTSSDHVGTTSDGTVYIDRYIENVEYGDSKTADDSNGTLEWAELAKANPWNIGTKGRPSDDQSNSFVQGKYYKNTYNRWGDIKIYLRETDDSTTPIYLKSLIVSSKTTDRYSAHGDRNYRVSFRATGTEINDCKPVKQRENDDKIIIYDKKADNNDKISNSTIDGLNNRFALFTLEDDEGNTLDGGNHYYTAVVNDHIVIGRVIQLTLDQFKSYGVARSYWRLASIEVDNDSPESADIKPILEKYFPETDVETKLDTSDEETGDSILSAVVFAADDSWAFNAW